MVRIIGYTADADYWCPDHAEEVYGSLKESETWYRLDHEGNGVHPIFSTDERPIGDDGQHYDEVCNACIWEHVRKQPGTRYDGWTLRD